jgi:hypothetical protein
MIDSGEELVLMADECYEIAEQFGVCEAKADECDGGELSCPGCPLVG